MPPAGVLPSEQEVERSSVYFTVLRVTAGAHRAPVQNGQDFLVACVEGGACAEAGRAHGGGLWCMACSCHPQKQHPGATPPPPLLACPPPPTQAPPFAPLLACPPSPTQASPPPARLSPSPAPPSPAYMRIHLATTPRNHLPAPPAGRAPMQALHASTCPCNPSMQVASTDTVLHPAGFIAIRGDGVNGTGGEVARIAPSNGFPIRLSSAQPIDSFFDLKHIKVRR